MRTVARLLASLLLIGLMVVANACSGAPPRTATGAPKSAEPTPNVQATVQVAVNATVQAQPRPTEARAVPTETPTGPIQESSTPTPAPQPTATPGPDRAATMAALGAA